MNDHSPTEFGEIIESTRGVNLEDIKEIVVPGDEPGSVEYDTETGELPFPPEEQNLSELKSEIDRRVDVLDFSEDITVEIGQAARNPKVSTIVDAIIVSDKKTGIHVVVSPPGGGVSDRTWTAYIQEYPNHWSTPYGAFALSLKVINYLKKFRK